MICLNCGMCCIDYLVVIVKPESATEDFDITNASEDDFIGKKSHDPCPHLYWEEGKSRCKIHHFSWYKDTPCFQFGQIESSPKNVCRIGEYMLRTRPGYYEKYCNEFRKTYLSPNEFKIKMELLLDETTNPHR